MVATLFAVSPPESDAGESLSDSPLESGVLPVDMTARTTLLAGKYRIDAVLADGGMAIVYKAWHTALEQPIAVKVLRPEYASNVEAVNRFQREAQSMARLRGNHCIHVLDAGSMDDGTPFMVLELLDGTDLRQLLRQRGPLSVSDAIGFMLQSARAVAEAHAQGLIHRDLKPDNLFLATQATGGEIIKLIDFGISKSELRSTTYATHAGNCLGSPQYMSPEQIRSAASVDARADVWSLGVTFYELATGCCPFQGTTLPSICASITYDDPVSPRQLRADLPEAFERVILRCLAKNPESRYDGMLPLIAELSCLDADPLKPSVLPLSDPPADAESATRRHMGAHLLAGDAPSTLPSCAASRLGLRHAFAAMGAVALAGSGAYFVRVNDNASSFVGRTNVALVIDPPVAPSGVDQDAIQPHPNAETSRATASVRRREQPQAVVRMTLDELAEEKPTEDASSLAVTSKANKQLPPRSHRARPRLRILPPADKPKAVVNDREIEARYAL